jgi:hypothetical protein
MLTALSTSNKTDCYSELVQLFFNLPVVTHLGGDGLQVAPLPPMSPVSGQGKACSRSGDAKACRIVRHASPINSPAMINSTIQFQFGNHPTLENTMRK